MVVVVLALYIFLYTLLFRPRAGYLCCGLFGGSFNRPIEGEILWKLKTLGLFNQTRGEHSCGVYNGNTLVKGVDGNKKFIDFVTNVGVEPNDGTNNLFIGHTRYATTGAHTEANAHPFLIEDKMIMAHNGKIENIWEAGKHVNIWTYLRSIDVNPAFVHVDSQALGHMLMRKGPKILESYAGYAALLIHKLEEPGVLYVYHGASKTYSTATTMTEERPLFMMETPEGYYFSSLKESLGFIRNKETDKEILTVPHNKVFSFKNGVMSKKVITINREEANIAPVSSWEYTKPVTTTTYPNTNASSVTKAAQTAANTKGTAFYTKEAAQRMGLDIERETIPALAIEHKDRVYYFRNRHYMPDGTLCHGKVVVDDKTGRVLASEAEYIDVAKLYTMYCWKGVFLKDGKKGFDIIDNAVSNNTQVGRHLSTPCLNFAKYISRYAKYPVTNIGDEAKDTQVNRECYFIDSEKVKSGAYTPIFSDRDYHFRDGLLVDVKGKGGSQKDDFFLPTGRPSTAPSGSGASEEAKGTEEYKSAFKRASQHSVSRCSGDAGSCGTNSRIGRSIDIADLGDDVTEVRRSFLKVYSSVEEIKEAFQSHNYVALYLYMQDVLEKIMGAVPEHTVVDQLIGDIYTQAVEQEVTLEELLDRGVEDIDYYITLAIQEGSEDAETSKKKDSLTQTSLFEEPATGAKIVPLTNDPNFHVLNQQEDEDMSVVKTKHDSLTVINEIMQEEQIAQSMIKEQDDEAARIIGLSVEYLETIRGMVVPLNQMEDSEMAAETVHVVLHYVDLLKFKLRTIAKTYGYDKVATVIERTLSNGEVGQTVL